MALATVIPISQVQVQYIRRCWFDNLRGVIQNPEAKGEADGEKHRKHATVKVHIGKETTLKRKIGYLRKVVLCTMRVQKAKTRMLSF